MLNARIRNAAVLPRAKRARRSTAPARKIRPKRANGSTLTASKAPIKKRAKHHALTFPSVTNDSCYLRVDWNQPNAWRTYECLSDEEWAKAFDAHIAHRRELTIFEANKAKAREQQLIAAIEYELKKNSMVISKK